ncbi:MAG: hypothetical protein K5821_10540 [Nitrobacter sp.]|uniref:hypothetical protein n=1 Tax=Nitrobacter sp. TaxID=29420 RepID=UPI002622AD35|nr:hypothetical protein [Nitrobacter sp.]MCV0386861.1 hypothetical protein [Nitrobacter sp.]
MHEALCKATAHWLAYKKAAGFMLASEALLIIPLAECFVSKGYDLKTEADTTRYNVGAPGLFNYDAIAERKDGSTIFLETKYLKGKFDVNRCLIDVMKLALPDAHVYQRLLLVAGEVTAIDRLSLNTEYRLEDFRHLAKSKQDFGKFLEKYEAEKSRPGIISIEASATVVADGAAAKVFSVSRK